MKCGLALNALNVGMFLKRRSQWHTLEEKMETAKIKIIIQNIEVEWECPECETVNNEWIYDYNQEETLCCCHCRGRFKGEIDVNL